MRAARCEAKPTKLRAASEGGLVASAGFPLLRRRAVQATVSQTGHGQIRAGVYPERIRWSTGAGGAERKSSICLDSALLGSYSQSVTEASSVSF